MSPLGEHIARFLQPDCWGEWVDGAFGAHNLKRHLSYMDSGRTIFHTSGVGKPFVDITGRLGWRDRRQIRKMVREMECGIVRQNEERAIAELLKA